MSERRLVGDQVPAFTRSSAVTTRILRHLPVPVMHGCPAGCDLPDAIVCWLRHERELRADLAAAGASPDVEVLRADLRAAERTIDRLIGLGLRAA